MSDIDKEKLRAYIDEQMEHLKTQVEARMKEDPEDDVAVRMDGGSAALHLLSLAISSGTLDVEDWPQEKKKPRTLGLARRSDPHTSWRAAWMQTTGASQLLYRVIYLVLSKKKCTDEELVKIVQHNIKESTPSSIRSRRSELVEAGWVKDSGQRRNSNAGSPMTVWESVPEEKNS